MTKKESELLKLLQRELAEADKNNSTKRRYSVAFKTSDPNYNCILIPVNDDSIQNIEYTIYYNDVSQFDFVVEDIDPSKTYYCSTWNELQELSSYLITHPEIFNPDSESLDLLSHPDMCVTVGDLDEYIETHSDYDSSLLYDDYSLED